MLNKSLLSIINSENLTKEQKEENMNSISSYWCEPPCSNYQSHLIFSAALGALSNDIEERDYWISAYFRVSGENKQDYINYLNRNK